MSEAQSVLYEPEPALTGAAAAVAEAQEALRLLFNREPERSWTPREAQAELQDRWSATIVSLAFWGLVREGELEVDYDLQVRAAAPPS